MIPIYQTVIGPPVDVQTVIEVEIEAKSVCTPEDAAYIFEHATNMQNGTAETMWLLACRTDMTPIGLFLLSKGSLSSTCISPRDIILSAIAVNAYSIFLAHNHPSGNLTPSEEDIQTTKRIFKACKLCDLHFADHIIVGPNNPGNPRSIRSDSPEIWEEYVNYKCK